MDLVRLVARAIRHQCNQGVSWNKEVATHTMMATFTENLHLPFWIFLLLPQQILFI